MNKAFLFLLMAIVAEVFGTTSLRLSDGFSKWGWVAGVVAGYGVAFYLMSQILKDIPIGIAYAIWSGLGTAATVGVGLWLFNEKIDGWKIGGVALIIVGVVVLNFFSRTEAA